MNTDELYHILRKRIFVSLPSGDEVKAVAAAYAQAVKEAKQMDITNASPEQFASQITESYPFHPAIRDLYARFRENPGFQQTRGLIRLMRIIVSRLFAEPNGNANKTYLVAPYDVDLNDRETLAEITLINPTVENAIGHDIASSGKAIAEIMDSNLGSTDAQDICKLLLVASLANIPNAVLGLSLSEIVSYLCSPGREITKIKEILGILATKAWYLHSNREGKLFFKNVQNLVAKLKTTAEGYNRESSLKELKSRLVDMFGPTLKDCYQEVTALPPVDEISIKPEKVTLVISEPVSDGLLHKDLLDFYNNIEYKNRVLFLTGQKGTLEALLETSAESKAILTIIAEMESEGVPENDPQRIAASELQDKIAHRLLSAARETFTTLIFPHIDGLKTADFLMNFTNNHYKGEQQIREALKSKQKFTEDITSDSFRKKCEERLFTQKVMLWAEVKKRAATNIKWQWHKPDALDNLKYQLVFQAQWREQGGYVEKPPFPQPKTEVRIKEVTRDDDTGCAILRLTPVNGDILHYEIGSAATSASLKVTDASKFETSELEVSFLCVDSKDEHETGGSVAWSNRITLKWRSFQDGEQKMAELRSAPAVPIRYTTDGSDPKTAGGAYNGIFAVPKGTVCILACGEKNGVTSEVYRWDVDWDSTTEVVIDKEKPAIWRRSYHPRTTKESYEFLDRAKKHEVSLCVPHLTVAGKNWIELQVDEKVYLTPEQLEKTLETLRGLLADGQVDIDAKALRFEAGQNLLDWVVEAKTEIKPGEVEQ